MFRIAMGYFGGCCVGISPVSYSPSQLKVSSKLKPSLTSTKLCSMTQALIILVANSSDTFKGLWKILHLLVSIPKEHSMNLLARHRRVVEHFVPTLLLLQAICMIRTSWIPQWWQVLVGVSETLNIEKLTHAGYWLPKCLPQVVTVWKVSFI
jgi:hypothetical protein